MTRPTSVGSSLQKMNEKDIERGSASRPLTPSAANEKARDDGASVGSDEDKRSSRSSPKEHGHDRGDSSDDTVAEPEDQRGPEKDPFEVGWDNGDSDPLNPRSMGIARKWLLVFITSFGSLCV